MLSFLQKGLEQRLSASSLKVYVAAITTHYAVVVGKSVGKSDLIIRLLKGVRKLNPPCPHLIPSWDLSLVLKEFKRESFEPLLSVEILSLKTALLTVLASVMRVRELEVFSID